MATIRIKRSTTAGAAPSSLATGEVAINEADGALYYRATSGAVSRFLSPQQGVVYSQGVSTSALVGRTVVLANTSAVTVTLDFPASVPVGGTIYFVRTGTGQVTFAPASGGLIYASPTNTMQAAYSTAVAIKVSTQEWVLNVLSETFGSTIGNGFTSTDLLGVAQGLITSPQSTPISGGTLVVNGLPLGLMDYVVKQGDQTLPVGTLPEADWYTTTEDSASAWIVINGSLNVPTGAVLIPTKRKLFQVVYVNGNLTLNGTISMSQRGANHSGTGVGGIATTARDIRIATGTWSGYTNPTVLAAGAAGGVGNGGAGSPAGVSGSSFFLAGGGNGSGNGTVGAGAAGTCFCGGGGGGAATPLIAIGANAGANGGAGGTGVGSPGGAGNPSGTPLVSGTENGAGGLLIVFVKGTVSGGGVFRSRGANVLNTGYAYGGGGSGGGLVVLMCTALAGVPLVTPTYNVLGGTSTGASTAQGGAGGLGRSVQITGL